MKNLPLIFSLLLLAACSTTAPKPKYSTQSEPNTKGSWKTIGRIHEGNIEIAYDTQSIERVGDIAYVRDRKIVRDQKIEAYHTLPSYKTAIAKWAFYCNQHTFRLENVVFWDNQKQIIAQLTYAANNMRPMLIVRDTPTQTLFDIVCTK